MDHSISTRVTLIKRVKEGKDEASWEEFIAVYKQYLYAVIRKMRITHHDAEEILQELFVKVWDRLNDFQYRPGKGRFRYWLCRIAKNSVIDFLRTRRADLDRLSKIESGERENYLNRIMVPEIEVVAEKEWRNFIANKALESVSRNFRKKEVSCFKLFVTGLSVAEIAEKLDLAENSVYIYKARVQELVRKEVRRLEDELG
jgi:RNA polymerase sigma-70 factor (ECF subfamily)